MRVRVQENGSLVRAMCQLPNGQRIVRVVSAEPAALMGELDAFPELGGRFLKKLGRGLKKAVVAPVKIAHKITHGKNSPIAKMEKSVQKFVGKNLPIAKPFINIHNSLAKPIHKAIEGKKVKKAITAKGIAEVTKNLPPEAKKAARTALVLKIKQTEALKDVAAKVAKAKVVSAAKNALARNPKNKPAAKVLAQAFPKGAFTVIFPDGKTRKTVPASKVG